MTGSQGRKTPTADQTIDDWFDLLDEDDSVSGPVPQGGGASREGAEALAEVTLGEAVFEAPPEQLESPDTWDWELSLSDGTPSTSVAPPPIAPVQETAAFEVAAVPVDEPEPVAIEAPPEALSGLADMLEPPEPEPPAAPESDEFDDFALDLKTPTPGASTAIDDPFAEPPPAQAEVPRPPSGNNRAPAITSELEAVLSPAAVEPVRPAVSSPSTPLAPQSIPSFPALPSSDIVPQEPTPRPRNTPSPAAPPTMWTPRSRNSVPAHEQPTPVPPAPPRHVADPDELEFEDSDAFQFDPAKAAPTSPPSALKPTPVMTFLDPEGARPTPLIPAMVPPEALASINPPQQRADDLTPLPGEAPSQNTARREMHERLDLGDFTGALALADSLIAVDPLNEDAQRVADTCRDRLRAIYLGRIGSLDQVPAMVIPATEIRWLALDHRAGFVLSLVDGVSTIEELVDVSSMEPLEVLRTLYNLITQNVVTLRRPRR